ncbi:MAG: hypothetical protein ACOCW3_05970 [Spirochaetota bacterium]
MQELSAETCRRMIDEGEVPESIRTASEKVAVVLTQSWCPDWLVMRRYLDGLDEPGLTVYAIVYDRLENFTDVMTFKETIFGNELIPYLRYYRNGRLVAETNAVYPKKRFLKKFAE